MKIELTPAQIYTLSDCIVQTMHDLRGMQKHLSFDIPQLQERIRRLNNLNSNIIAQVENGGA